MVVAQTCSDPPRQMISDAVPDVKSEMLQQTPGVGMKDATATHDTNTRAADEMEKQVVELATIESSRGADAQDSIVKKMRAKAVKEASRPTRRGEPSLCNRAKVACPLRLRWPLVHSELRTRTARASERRPPSREQEAASHSSESGGGWCRHDHTMLS